MKIIHLIIERFILTDRHIPKSYVKQFEKENPDCKLNISKEISEVIKKE